MNKPEFYSQQHISKSYDQIRFGGPSGEWVNRRELSVVTSFLPPAGKVLDLGCGTGRLSLHLADRGYEVVGIDSSDAMLAVARGKPGSAQVDWLRGDAFNLPFTPVSFDAVVALRLAFHFAELRPFLLAVIGVAKTARSIVLDTYNWSPRALVALGGRRWGGRIYAHPPTRMIQEVAALGLELVDHKGCFLFSPYVYRRLPLRVVRGLERLEELLSDRLKARVFWHLQLSEASFSQQPNPKEAAQDRCEAPVVAIS